MRWSASGRSRSAPSPRSPPAEEQLPASLAAVLNDRLSSVSAEAARLLRAAALLGGTFAVTDLAVVARRPASDLAAAIEEAVAAGILIGSGPDLAFRHLLLHQALYESMPVGLAYRVARRGGAGDGGDGRGCPERRAAAVGRAVRGADWVRTGSSSPRQRWPRRAPRLAAELLRRELEDTPARHDAWDG